MKVFLLAFFLSGCATEKKTIVTVETPAPPLQVLTLDNMDQYEGNLLKYVLDAPKLRADIGHRLRINRDLCKQGHDLNCQALDQIKSDRENFEQGLIDIMQVKSCSTQYAVQERKTLTNKISPQLMQELKHYKDAYKRETGKAIDLTKCE